jgi:glycosyltransferase involved in cell wall biosynthesis
MALIETCNLEGLNQIMNDVPANSKACAHKLNLRPTISVVINNYNYESFVGTAIRSVLAQTYKGVQCIVVDDGSTDRSRDIISQFDGIKKIFKDNGGQTSAIRLGVEQANSDIIILLDSDDYLYNDACATIAERWTQDTVLVQYKLDIAKPDGRIVGEYPLQPFITSGQYTYSLKWGEFPSSPTSGNAFSCQYLREALKLIGDRDIKFADGYFVFSAPLHGNIQVINRSLGAYLVHGDNVSMSARQSLDRVRAQILVNISQKRAIANQLSLKLHRCVNYKSILAPFHWRSIAYILRAYPDVADFKEFSSLESRMRGIYAYVYFPSIPLWKRLKNILVLLFLPLMPLKLIKGKIPI